MKIEDLKENVVDFPDRKRDVTLDKLRKKSSYYKDSGAPTDSHPDLRIDWAEELRNKIRKAKANTPLRLVDAEQFPSVKTLTVGAIAYKHNVTVKSIRQQLTKGIRVEKEHTTDARVAKEIALDHIAEYPDYYDRLESVEEGQYEDQIRRRNKLAGKHDGTSNWEIDNNKKKKPAKFVSPKNFANKHKSTLTPTLKRLKDQ